MQNRLLFPGNDSLALVPLALDHPTKVIHTASHDSLLTVPAMKTERVRTTISITPQALSVFKRMAEAGNMSISRCMGDWLVDTAEAAEMLTTKMEEAKRAPLRVMKEMRAMVAGLSASVDETEDWVRQRKQADSDRRAPRPGADDASEPPSSNTGVLVPPGSPAKSKSSKSYKGI